MSIILLLLLLQYCSSTKALNIATDTSTLVAFKTHITNSSTNNLMNNWNISTPVCEWIGVTCGAHHQRVTTLDIHGMDLTGTISPHLGNLSFLVKLHLGGNRFHGLLPKELAQLHRLEFIDVSSNNFVGNIPTWFGLLPRLKSLFLASNSFVGRIPPSIFNCSRLEDLVTSFNPLNSGVIPREISKLKNLKYLSMRLNQLTGPIAISIFNISSLEYINLAYNSLTGTIPGEIGNCTLMEEIILANNYFTGGVPESITSLGNLRNLSFEHNSLSGRVPAGYFNISSLLNLGLTQNNLTGDLPQTLGSGMPNLQGLYLSSNSFTGSISGIISNASKITLLSLGENKFTGSVPITIGNLRYLQRLSITRNNLVISNDDFKMFIDSLTNCRHLIFLAINENSINGATLPPSLGNLSTSLQQFRASRCGIVGEIPQDIGNLSNLIYVALDENHLVGSLPKTLGRLSQLQWFTAPVNSLSGPIPNEVCNLLKLDMLVLTDNNFTGPLPACLGNVSSLRYLYLGANKLSNEIPASLWSLKDLLVLDLYSNAFTGHFPPEIGSFRALTAIDLSRNQLSGHVPSTIGSIRTLDTLYLADNRFQGSIPESLGTVLSLESLDLSDNDLSGKIPKSLEALLRLNYLNLSFNRLSGEIPSRGPFSNLTYSSFENNSALCGPTQFRVPQCPQEYTVNSRKRKRSLPLVYLFTGIALLLMILFVALFLLLKCRNMHQVSSAVDLQLATTRERISYHQLLQATNSFDSSNLLGVGGFGSVYKGVFANGKTLAVKVFNTETERAIRSFSVECEMLRNIRHRNLVKIVTSCSNLDFMALVLEYMPNGSLDKWLYSHNFFLDVKQRLDIMIDVAYALAYLHHGNTVPVVHCDLKPSNILLDDEMIAHVSDFGIAKFLKEEGSGEQTETLATIGYTAPEYGREGLVSMSSDVYSFGIILMEVFTRKRPTDEMFGLELSLKSWVSESLQRGVAEVIDENLIRQEEDEGQANVQCVSSILELATICSADLPDERTAMEDVLASLEKIKFQFFSNSQ